jgi:hypothetical protein
VTVLFDDERQFFDALPLEPSPLIEAGRKLHDAIFLSISPALRVGREGVNKRVARTLLALIARGTKTYRAIELAVGAGLDSDAHALLRTLFETTIAVEWIRKEHSEHRAALFNAYVLNQPRGTLNAWQSNAALRASVEDVGDRRARLESLFDSLAADLAGDESWKDHWSGRGSLENVCRDLNAHAWYDTVFRQASLAVHPSDLLDQMHDAANDIGVGFSPSPKQVPVVIGLASFLLYRLARGACEALGVNTGVLEAARPSTGPASSQSASANAARHGTSGVVRNLLSRR